MKKILILIFSIFLIGCNVDRKIDIKKVEQQLLELIPSSTYENIGLPKYETIKTTWSCDYSYIIGDYWIYEEPSEDKVFHLYCKLERDEEVFDLVFDVKALSKGKEYYYNILREMVPEEINYDYNLPTFSNLFKWTSNDVVINDENKLIYDFPSVDKNISVSAFTDDFSIPLNIKILDKDSIKDLPVLNVYTDKSIDSKEEYVKGLLNVNENNVFTNYDMKIRLRGNSTSVMPKKPYKIKLDQKSELLGLNSNKDFVLLANFADQTLIRNALALNFSKKIRGEEWTPDYVYVDLFINNTYQGNYMLVEQIEEAKNKVDLSLGGYLIEYDLRAYEEHDLIDGKDYFIIDGEIPYVIKYPDVDVLSSSEFNDIKNETNKIFQEIKNNDISNIDLESFLSWFFVNEVFKNVDAGYSSVYLYKKPNERLKMGPVWDFDLSSGNFGHIEYQNKDYSGWYTSLSYKNRWYYQLFKSRDFIESLKTYWDLKVRKEAYLILEDIENTANKIRKSRYENFITWDIIGKNNDWYTGEEILKADTYHKQIELLSNFLKNRIEWIDKEIKNL